MKFIQVNGDLINIAHVVKISLSEVPMDNGDFYIMFMLSNGEIAHHYDVSYQAIYDQWEHIYNRIEVIA